MRIPLALTARLAGAAGDQLLGRVVAARAPVEQLVGLRRAEAEAEQALARERARVVVAGDGASGSRSAPAPATFSRSSTMIRSAVRLPMPGTAWKRAASPAASALRSSRGVPPESTASATFGPDPLDADQHQEQLALAPRYAKPKSWDRVVAHDEVGVEQNTSPARDARSVSAETARR